MRETTTRSVPFLRLAWHQRVGGIVCLEAGGEGAKLSLEYVAGNFTFMALDDLYASHQSDVDSKF